MKTLFTLIKKTTSSYRLNLRVLTILTILLSSFNLAKAEVVETVLYSQSGNFEIGSNNETTLFTSEDLYHKDGTNITYSINSNSWGSGLFVSIRVNIYTISYDINGNIIPINGQNEYLSDSRPHSENTTNTNISLVIAENCNNYKVIIKGQRSGIPIWSTPKVFNTSIKANTAIAENLKLSYNGEDSVNVSWSNPLPDQRQYFIAELLNSDETENWFSEVTEGNSTTVTLPSSTESYKIRVLSYGDGQNKNNFVGESEKLDIIKTNTTTSRFFMPAENLTVRLRGRNKFYVNILNASGDITKTDSVTLGSENGFVGRVVTFIRDANSSTPTLLDNEFQVQVIGENAESTLAEAPFISVGENVYNENYLAQLASSINGSFNDKFELIETLEDATTLSNTRTTIYENEEVVFALKGSTKHIDLLSPQIATTGGYQAVVRFDAYKSNEGHNPKLEFFIADMNNNIIADITAPSLIVEDKIFTDKVVTIAIPSTINVAHRLIIRCSAYDKQNPNVTCTLNKLRISRHDNIATNVQLNSCGNNLNVSWDIINSDPSITNQYIVQILGETGKTWIAQSEAVSGNSTSISLDNDFRTSRSYTVRVMTLGANNTNLGVSALNNFVYIKAGETLDVNTVSSIQLLLLGIEDSGLGALNRVAQLTTSNENLSVNKVALQLKITSGQYYFTSFPFQPDQVFVNCDEATHRSNILLRSFNSESYSNSPNSFSASYPVMGDGTSTMPLSDIERGKGYLLSVNKSVTGGTAGNVHVTITGNVSTQTSRYINYNLQELDVQSASVTDEEIGDGYGYKGWNLLANPFPRTFTLENNFYVSVYKIPSASSTSGSEDGKVAAAGYSVYRSTPNDTIPAFVPFFVQSDAATFAMKPRTISSSAAAEFSQELRLSLSDGNSFDEVILNLDEEASQFYTIGKDLVKMSSLGSGVPQISSRIGNENLVVRALTNEMAEEGVPVELFIGKSGKQSLSIASSEWDGEYEYFVRNANGEEFILNNGAYEFEGVAGKTTKITFFARTMPLSVEDEIAQRVVVSQLGDAIEISAPETIENIKLFNLNGSLVKSSTPMSETSTIKSIATGAYILEINMATSREVVKVVIQ
ncbi:MAG: T9SS type A sorting domain-containing protein [Bacteroidales bacterium]